ncbi:hypothetical protein [Cellulomonas edaphi]|uniref:Glycosyl transferase n=1 Tax=Cellulomonas edaphi TaxID=3053468 RepID=A0ABT7S5U0_9CELL|nr:hypothetical protein [Cellulomons edaphi]MDM7830987.1 hypothetical protein [Cellulomons edaphi]
MPRYLPVDRFAWWNHTARWMQYGAVSGLFLYLVLSGTLLSWHVVGQSLLVVLGLQLVIMTPYLTLRRSDQSTAQRVAVYATAPLLGLWQATFLRGLRWYSIATFRKAAASWGTRGTVEVAA